MEVGVGKGYCTMLIVETVQAWETAVQNGSVYEKEHRLITKTGEYRWHLSRAFPFKDKQGKVMKWFGTATDIHSQKTSEEKLRYLSTLTRSISDALIGTDKDFVINNWNKGAERMYGWAEQEVIGKRGRDVLETIFVDKSKEQEWSESLRQHGFWHGEVLQRRKDGETMNVLVSISLIHDDSGNIIGAAAINRDITDLKSTQNKLRQGEQEVRDAKEQLEVTLQNIPSAIFHFDKSGRMIYLNDKAAAIFGFDTVEEVLVHNDITNLRKKMDESYRILDEYSRPLPFEESSAARAFRTGKSTEGISQFIRRKDNSSFWLLSNSTPKFSDDGDLLYVLTTCTDITLQKIAEENIRKSEEHLRKLVDERTRELQRSNDDLQQFAHVASHDLKEPVRKVKTFGTLLKEEFGQQLPGIAQKYLNKIESAADRMYSMIDGVLLYSSLGAHEQTVDPINLNEIISNIMSDLEIPITKRKATINYGSLPMIQGTPILIYQLFYNLLNNSLKFARPNEDSVITIHSDPTSQEGSFVEILVRDNGIGFNQNEAGKIFKTFTRLNSKDQYEGTGLGLALCKKIVERHGGTIRAEGKVDEGSTFFITLPLLRK
jgi:PAS domain S-box-containing protein